MKLARVILVSTLTASMLTVTGAVEGIDGRVAAQTQPIGVEGQLELVDTAHSEIVVRVGQRERRGQYSPMTRFTVDGMPGAVTDLRPGMRVRLQFAMSESGRESTRLVAVDARR